MFKSHKIKKNHRVLGKNEVDTYGAQVWHLIIVYYISMVPNPPQFGAKSICLLDILAITQSSTN
jgi:hypothetical protein